MTALVHTSSWETLLLLTKEEERGGGMFGGSEREGQFMNVVKEDRQRVGVTEEDAKAEKMKADDLL